MIALWLWNSQAWTTPLSALQQMWLGLQAATVLLPILFLTRPRHKK